VCSKAHGQLVTARCRVSFMFTHNHTYDCRRRYCWVMVGKHFPPKHEWEGWNPNLANTTMLTSSCPVGRLCCSTQPLLPASDDTPADDTPAKTAAAVKAYLTAATTHASLAPPAFHYARPSRRAAAMRPADKQRRRRLLVVKEFNPGEALCWPELSLHNTTV
jgi:hypothetical protein